jgi:hypothetical protein
MNVTRLLKLSKTLEIKLKKKIKSVKKRVRH